MNTLLYAGRDSLRADNQRHVTLRTNVAVSPTGPRVLALLGTLNSSGL